MDVKKILLISLIAVAIVASVSVVSAGLFDGLFGGEDVQDNVIEMDGFTFNTTNVTKFKLFLNETDEFGACDCSYIDENDTGYTINILNCSGLDESTVSELFNYYAGDLNNCSSQTVDGVVVYTTAANTGENIGDTRYVATIENNNLSTIVDISTPDLDETVKIASTFKFI